MDEEDLAAILMDVAKRVVTILKARINLHRAILVVEAILVDLKTGKIRVDPKAEEILVMGEANPEVIILSVEPVKKNLNQEIPVVVLDHLVTLVLDHPVTPVLDHPVTPVPDLVIHVVDLVTKVGVENVEV